MFSNLTKFGQSAAQRAAKYAENLSSNSQTSTIQSQYNVGAEVGSAGTGGVWRVHRASPKKGVGPHPICHVFQRLGVLQTASAIAQVLSAPVSHWDMITQVRMPPHYGGKARALVCTHNASSLVRSPDLQPLRQCARAFNGPACSSPQRKLAVTTAGGPKEVSVWFLDKRQLHDPSRPVDIRPIIALLEGECKQTSRLRHPGIVSVIQPMDETRTHLIWVTEEVTGSLMSWVAGGSKVRCCFYQQVLLTRMPRCHLRQRASSVAAVQSRNSDRALHISTDRLAAAMTHHRLGAGAGGGAMQQVTRTNRAHLQGAERDGPCELEVKHGLVQIAETLHFLHKSCNLAHCNLSPESIIIAADGTWKLGGLAFATPVSPNGALDALQANETICRFFVANRAMIAPCLAAHMYDGAAHSISIRAPCLCSLRGIRAH